MGAPSLSVGHPRVQIGFISATQLTAAGRGLTFFFVPLVRPCTTGCQVTLSPAPELYCFEMVLPAQMKRTSGGGNTEES